MLYHVYLIMVVMYFVFLILATLTRKGGYALFAMLDLLIVMWASAYFIQVPYSPELQVGIENLTTATLPNETQLYEVLPKTVPTALVFDPMTAQLFLPWFFVTIVVYGWCTRWGFRMDRGWF